MALKSIEFVGRGQANSILQSVIGGQNVSLTAALSDAVNLTRDANNNQLSQEAATIKANQFERTFSEDRLRDRRNFGEGVLRDRRNFTEESNRFDVTAADRDADRALNAELGRGRLAVSRAGLALNEQKFGLTERVADFNFDALERKREDELLRQEDLNEVRERERIANDPELFRKSLQGEGDVARFDDDTLDVMRKQELGRVARDYEFLERSRSANANFLSQTQISTIPGETPRDQAASVIEDEAADLVQQGRSDLALARLAEAGATAEEGSPTAARITEITRQIQAEATAQAQGSSISSKAASAASAIFNDNQRVAFDDSTFGSEVAKVASATTRSEYVRGGTPDADLTDPQADRRDKLRGKFYDSVKSSSASDRLKVRQTGDPFAGILPPVNPPVK